MKTSEQDSTSVTYERVRTVFTSLEEQVPPQMVGTFNRLLDKSIKRNAPKPVPVIELEGIKEILENLWHPALTQQLSKFMGSAMFDPDALDEH